MKTISHVSTYAILHRYRKVCAHHITNCPVISIEIWNSADLWKLDDPEYSNKDESACDETILSAMDLRERIVLIYHLCVVVKFSRATNSKIDTAAVEWRARSLGCVAVRIPFRETRACRIHASFAWGVVAADISGVGQCFSSFFFIKYPINLFWERERVWRWLKYRNIFLFMLFF